MQFSASLLELEADGLKNKGHKERRDSFIISTYLNGRCLEIPLCK